MNSLETTVCPECGQVLHNSGYAACPECGYPLAEAPDQESRELAQAETKAKRTGRILTLTLLLGLAAIVVVISNFSGEPPKGPETAPETSLQLFDKGPEASKTDQIFSVKGNMRTLQVMLETYAADWQGRYPDSLEQLKAEATQPKLIYWKDFSNPVTAARGIGSLGAMAESSAYTPKSELRGFVLYEALPEAENCISGYRITGTDPEGLLITQEPDSEPYSLIKEAGETSPCKAVDAPVLIGDAKPGSPSPSPSGSHSASPASPAATSEPGASAPATEAQTAIEAGDIESTLRSWQALKREAFLAEDDSRLSEVLSGPALEDTRGGLQWWISQDAMYKDIQLHELKILNQTDLSETEAEAEVSISETKDNTVQGRNTSTYKAKYTLEKKDGRWFITGIQAE